MLYFLIKAGKIAAALGAPSPNPRWPLAAQTPKLLLSLTLSVPFDHCSRFLGIVKITTNIISYLSDG